MASKQVVCTVVVVLFFVYLHAYTDASPIKRILERQKRVSDQRLAELETLIALSRMKGRLVTVPVGFGRVDPNKLGRRRRSEQKLLRTLVEDLASSEEQDEGDRQSLTASVEDRLDERELLLNLLYNEELERKFRNLPVRLPAD